MIPCSAYGLNITPAQCAAARAWFSLARICGDCRGQDLPTAPPPAEIIEPEFIPLPPRSRVGGVPRSGPTIATALRGPISTCAISQTEQVFLEKTSAESEQIPAKPALHGGEIEASPLKHRPLRPCPPDMTPAVWRRLRG